MFRGTNTVFRDVLMLLSCGLLSIVILMVAHLNPPQNEDDADIDAPGSVVFEIFWPNDRNVDVDMWVKTPKEDRPVFYKHRNNRVASLLRDDRGDLNDEFERNDEILFVRGLQAGEYVFNIHYYSSSRVTSAMGPVRVRGRISLSLPDRATVTIFQGEYTLDAQGDEHTYFRFTLDRQGNVVLKNQAQISLVEGQVYDYEGMNDPPGQRGRQ